MLKSKQTEEIEHKGNKMKLEDIAKIANVSVSAVSLALNNRPGISEKTRAKILTIVDQQNYVPPKNSKLNVHKIKILAASNLNINQNIYYVVLQNLSRLGKKDKLEYNLEIYDRDSLSKIIKDIIAEKQYDCIILFGEEDLRKDIENANFPILMINYYYLKQEVNTINVDKYAGGYIAANLALRNSYKIAFIKSFSNKTNRWPDAQEGIIQSLNEHNLKKEELKVFTKRLNKSEDYTKEIKEIKEKSHYCFICESDTQAINVIRSCSSLHLKVPEDVGIISLDYFSNNKNIFPPLTRLRVPTDQFSKLINDKIEQMLSDKNFNTNTFITPRVVLGNSINLN